MIGYKESRQKHNWYFHLPKFSLLRLEEDSLKFARNERFLT